MVEHAILCGEALIKVRAGAKHGAWAGWLAENFEAKRQTAQNYMLLASNSARVRNLGDISLRKALEAISKEEKDDKKKTAMADTLASRAACVSIK
jgi:hypothetical protein